MSRQNEFSEIFIRQYTEKLFYFCLKKTGNRFDAEDLTSDISVNILTTLKKGFVPDNFPAWVWQIARNRYSRWADKRRRYNEVVVTDDFDSFEIADKRNIENDVIHSDEIALLKRELAFISADYRSIIVEFYIKDRKINDIADSLKLPKGTVMTKLYRARNILKEGMNMARQFGAKSYNPEDIDFSSSGNQPSGLPWSAVQRSIPKNILIEASNNPSTAEELAVALGIAMPYMEEEIKLLVDATLLKKLDDGRYITDFYISSAECQLKINDAILKESKKRSAIINEIIDSSIPFIRSLGVVPDNMSDNDVKWWAAMFIPDLASNYACGAKQDSILGYIPKIRANDEDWGFMGYESVELPRPMFSGQNGCGLDSATQFWTYKISNFGMWNRVGEMERTEMLFLADIIKNPRKVESFSVSEQLIWAGIDGKFAHEENGTVIPDILVIGVEARKAMLNRFNEHPLYNEYMALTVKLFEEIKELVKKDTTKYNAKDADYAAAMFILHTRMSTVYDMVDSGDLVIPENPDKSRAAMWIDLAN